MSRRRVAGSPELSGDTLRVIFEMAHLDSFVFWPNVAEACVLEQVRCAMACTVVNRAWRDAAVSLPTRLCGQPPETFGDDACGERHKLAFGALARTRSLETLDLYTLGNHAKAPPSSGRTRVEVEPLLALPRLKTLRLSASAVAHAGASLAELAVAIARSGVSKCCFRLKTGDQKPKALVVSPRHKDQPLDKLAEAALTSPEAVRCLSVRYEQRPGTAEEYNRALVLERRSEAPTDRLARLVAAHDGLVCLDSELTLLALYSPPFARRAATAARAAGAQLALRFDNRMSDTDVRRFHRLEATVAAAVAQVRWSDDEARSAKVLDLLPSLTRAGPVKLVGRSIQPLPCFDRLVELSLTGDPTQDDAPRSAAHLDLRRTVEPRRLASKGDARTCVFDLAHHTHLRRLTLSGGQGAHWIVRRFPPAATHVTLANVQLRPDAYASLRAPDLDSLRLHACAPAPDAHTPFSLPNWLLATGVVDCSVSDCDKMHWSLGASLDDLCLALRKSRIQRLRLSAILANAAFDRPLDLDRDASPSPAPWFRLLGADADAATTRAQLETLFTTNSSVFFDLYYRSGHFLDRHPPDPTPGPPDPL